MEPATADLRDDEQQQEQQQQQEKKRKKKGQQQQQQQGGKRVRALPLWLIVLVTTCVTVFAPVLVGLLLIACNSNARLAATQLRSVTANASGLAQLVVERLVAAESAAHYISSFIRFSAAPMVYDSPHFYHTLAQALVSFDAFAHSLPCSNPHTQTQRQAMLCFLPPTYTARQRHASQTSATTCTD